MSEFVAEINLGNFNKVHLKSATVEELLQSLADVAAVSPAIVEQVQVVQSAGKALAVGSQVAPSIDRPAGKATAEPGSNPPPKCGCGIAMNDCAGKSTKAGNPYKFRYYSACKNDDCKPRN